MRKRRLHFASDERRLHFAPCGARLARLAFLLLLAATPGVTYAQSGAPQTDAAGRVSVLFTALGRDKKFNTSLKPEDIRVSVDGAEREVSELKRQSGVPLFLAVVIDTSASQESVLPKTKMAAGVFVRGMMSPGVDEAAVVTFATDTTLEQGMTADVSKVRAAIARVRFVPPPGYVGDGVLVGSPPPGNSAGTGVWDAVWLVSRDVMSRSLGTGRRAMLLVTDGVDTSSRVKLDEAVASALQSEVVIYAVGPDLTDDGGARLSDEFPYPAGSDVGFRLWDVTSGRHLRTERSDHHVLDLVGLVEDHHVMLGEYGALAGEMGPVEMGVDHDDVGRRRLVPRRLGEALLSRGAPVRPGTLPRSDAHHGPGPRAGLEVQLGPITALRPGAPAEEAAGLRGHAADGPGA